MNAIETYRDLLNVLGGFTAEQLAQPVQIADPESDGRPVELARCIALGTVGEFEFEGARSVVDNKYHAEEVVVLIDGNPFSEDGATSYLMKSDGPEQRLVHRMVPRYGAGGPTKREEQRAPKRVDFPAYVGMKCETRAADFRDAD